MIRQRLIAQSSAPRVQAHRERRREAGLVRVEAWVRPELVPLVRRYIARLSKSTSADSGDAAGKGR